MLHTNEHNKAQEVSKCSKKVSQKVNNAFIGPAFQGRDIVLRIILEYSSSFNYRV
jgi:hypothetical protein